LLQQTFTHGLLSKSQKETTTPKYSLKDLIIYFLKLGTWGFGGPVALVGYMHRDVVNGKKWINEEDYKEGLALSQQKITGTFYYSRSCYYRHYPEAIDPAIAPVFLHY
jgi:hypothetical protein